MLIDKEKFKDKILEKKTIYGRRYYAKLTRGDIGKYNDILIKDENKKNVGILKVVFLNNQEKLKENIDFIPNLIVINLEEKGNSDYVDILGYEIEHCIKGIIDKSCNEFSIEQKEEFWDNSESEWASFYQKVLQEEIERIVKPIKDDDKEFYFKLKFRNISEPYIELRLKPNNIDSMAIARKAFNTLLSMVEETDTIRSERVYSYLAEIEILLFVQSDYEKIKELLEKACLQIEIEINNNFDKLRDVNYLKSVFLNNVYKKIK